MSKILIIGHSVLDRIYYKDRLLENPGGVFHTVNTLVNLAESEDEFYLATHISENSYKYFEVFYNKINLDFSEYIGEIPIVTLNLYDDRERDEQYSKNAKRIILPDEIFDIQFDLILVNMISGFDILAKDLQRLKEKTNSEIYFDIHTLSRGFDETGNRVFRIIPSVEDWLANIDILQMNENEMKTLWGIDSEKENINRLLKNNIDKVIVTKGEKGVSLYHKGNERFFPSIKINSINFVGCGDSFGAAFSYYYSKNKNLYSAVDFANFVAGIITSYDSPTKYKNLKYDIAKRYN